MMGPRICLPARGVHGRWRRARTALRANVRSPLLATAHARYGASLRDHGASLRDRGQPAQRCARSMKGALPLARARATRWQSRARAALARKAVEGPFGWANAVGEPVSRPDGIGGEPVRLCALVLERRACMQSTARKAVVGKAMAGQSGCAKTCAGPGDAREDRPRGTGGERCGGTSAAASAARQRAVDRPDGIGGAPSGAAWACAPRAVSALTVEEFARAVSALGNRASGRHWRGRPWRVLSAVGEPVRRAGNPPPGRHRRGTCPFVCAPVFERRACMQSAARKAVVGNAMVGQTECAETCAGPNKTREDRPGGTGGER